MSLSDKIIHNSVGYAGSFYPQEDVKEHVRLLKEFFADSIAQEFIDEIFGEDLK